jgi:hypothetical protein
MQLSRSGMFGLAVTLTGGLLLGISFIYAYRLYEVYLTLVQSANTAQASTQFLGSLDALLQALVPVMILAVMGWIGSIFLTRGVDFMKVDRGVGLVTLKVDKSVGVVDNGSGQAGLVTAVEMTKSSSKKNSDPSMTPDSNPFDLSDTKLTTQAQKN